MTRPLRIVSTSDRYDLQWERSRLAERPDLDLELIGANPTSERELIEVAHGADALVISAREAITETILQSLPNLIVIGRNSVGLDNIDLAAATRHGVVVTHFPAYCTHEVADHTIALMYALNRRIPQFDRDLRNGAWVAHQYHMDRMLRGPIHAMRTLTLGLIGLGRIGRQVALRMSGSVAGIIVADPYIDQSTATEFGASLVDLDHLLLNADIISLHCPLTPETRGLINRERLALLKHTAYLINTARGPIIDLDALTDSLEAGAIAGAALDVVYPEPLPFESRLHGLPNVILTPHAAYYSEESVEAVRRETLDSVIDVLGGFHPPVVANPDVLQTCPLRARNQAPH